jgi:hypothetical protein
MDFELSKEAKMIQDAARTFSKNVLEPNASEILFKNKNS